jgi:hypothetical protein
LLSYFVSCSLSELSVKDTWELQGNWSESRRPCL